MIEPRFLDVLRLIVSRLDGSGIHWAITGSLGMALHGMQLPVHDIDLQTDRDGAFEFGRRFSAFVVRPVAYAPKDRIRSYLGALLIDGIQVEIIGDMQTRRESGIWEPPVRVLEHTDWVEVEEMHVPAMALEHEYQAYLQMGRAAKAGLILEFLQHAGARTDPASKAQPPFNRIK